MWMTKTQVQKLFGISHTTLDRWMKAGKIPYQKFGNNKQSSVRFKKEDVLKFLQTTKKN